MTVDRLLAGKRICICAGAGGVGKTTSAAAIALGMAARGRKVAVVTIDPARRLADALGLDELENEPRRVDPERLGPAGGGELWAMMLDPQRTFDELIDRVAPSPDRAAEIKDNRIYRQLSGAVSGSQEFTAVAKLSELARTGAFDLIVLDTPPSRNALEFLEAPGRLTGFLEGTALRTLIRPASFGVRGLLRGASPLLGALKRVTGLDLLSDLSTFFGLLGDMTDDFAARAGEVRDLLAAPSTAFLLITSAAGAAVDEALWFRRTLAEARLPFAGAIANRVHHDRLGDLDAEAIRAGLPAGISDELAERVVQATRELHVLARRDAHNLARLITGLGDGAPVPVIEVPQLDGEVHDVAGLARIERFLFASTAERERLLADAVG